MIGILNTHMTIERLFADGSLGEIAQLPGVVVAVGHLVDAQAAGHVVLSLLLVAQG